MKNVEYLGDGVYVQRRADGSWPVVILTTGRHFPTGDLPGDKPDATIHLDPEVLDNLVTWLKKTKVDE
jgi:hypothetical protein